MTPKEALKGLIEDILFQWKFSGVRAGYRGIAERYAESLALDGQLKKMLEDYDNLDGALLVQQDKIYNYVKSRTK